MNYADLVETINSRGGEVLISGGHCPVQVQGYLPCCTPFYFRARGEWIGLELYCSDFLGAQHDLPSDEDLIYDEHYFVGSWGDFEAGYIDADTAYYALSMLLSDAKSIGVIDDQCTIAPVKKFIPGLDHSWVPTAKAWVSDPNWNKQQVYLREQKTQRRKAKGGEQEEQIFDVAASVTREEVAA